MLWEAHSNGVTFSGDRRTETGPALLDRWVRQGLISPEQAARIAVEEDYAAVVAPTDAASLQRGPSLAAEALGYLGGALALAAALLLTGMLWNDLSIAVRLALPAAAALVLFLAGWLVGGSAGAASRLRAAMWLLGLVAWSAFLAVLGHDSLDLDAQDTWLLGGVGSALLALPLYARVRSAPQQLGAFLALVIMSGALAARADWQEPTLVGLAGWTVAAAWFALGEAGRLPPDVAARYLGAVGAVVAAQMTGGAALGHGLVAVTLAALFVVGVRAESVGLLAVAAVGTLEGVPNAVAFFVGDQVRLAAPIALLVAGGVLVGVAVTVVRRRGTSGRNDGTGLGAGVGRGPQGGRG